jgi:uncharacterized membrane protein
MRRSRRLGHRVHMRYFHRVDLPNGRRPPSRGKDDEMQTTPATERDGGRAKRNYLMVPPIIYAVGLPGCVCFALVCCASRASPRPNRAQGAGQLKGRSVLTPLFLTCWRGGSAGSRHLLHPCLLGWKVGPVSSLVDCCCRPKALAGMCCAFFFWGPSSVAMAEDARFRSSSERSDMKSA